MQEHKPGWSGSQKVVKEAETPALTTEVVSSQTTTHQQSFVWQLPPEAKPGTTLLCVVPPGHAFAGATMTYLVPDEGIPPDGLASIPILPENIVSGYGEVP